MKSVQTLLRLALILLAATLSACAGSGVDGGSATGAVMGIDTGGVCGLGARNTLPVDMALGGRAPMLRVQVNGVPRHFLLDTGGSHSSIERRIALALGLMHDTKPVSIRDVTGVRSLDSIEIDSVQVGALNFEHQRFLVSDGLPYDGTLGMDVLGHGLLDIDEVHASVNSYAGRLCGGGTPIEDAKLIEMPAIRVPAVKGGKPGAHLQVAMRLNGTLGLAIFDTGAIGGSLLSPVFAEKAGVTAEMLAADPTVSPRGFGTTTTAHLHRFDQLDLNGEICPRPVLLISPDPGMQFNLVIGADYFRTHRVWFDFANERIFSLPLVQQRVPGS